MATKKALSKVHVKHNINSYMIIKMVYTLYFLILTLLSHSIAKLSDTIKYLHGELKPPRPQKRVS